MGWGGGGGGGGVNKWRLMVPSPKPSSFSKVY